MTKQKVLLCVEEKHENGLVFQKDAASCLDSLSIGELLLFGRGAPSQRPDLAGPGLASPGDPCNSVDSFWGQLQKSFGGRLTA